VDSNAAGEVAGCLEIGDVGEVDCLRLEVDLLVVGRGLWDRDRERDLFLRDRVREKLRECLLLKFLEPYLFLLLDRSRPLLLL